MAMMMGKRDWATGLFFLTGGWLILLFLLPGCKPVASLGKNPSGERLKKIEALPNYQNGEFQNIDRSVTVGFTSSAVSSSLTRRPRWLGMLKYLFAKPEITRPQKDLPAVITDLKKTTFQTPTVIWFGHSSFLLKTATANILFDPIFGNNAGPLARLVPAFKGTTDYGVTDMPVIDALVISHDHYDHLDYETVKRLRKKVKRVIVPIGVGSHFEKWGYDAKLITELNWNDSVKVNDQIIITATPAHHRSNRTFAQRKTLWASYVIQADGYKLYFSGDTGYSKHFALIGERHGPFDLAMLECGQYNKRWSGSHMHPSLTAKAAVDLKARMVLPVHWGKFAESDHAWNEPPNLLLKNADSLGVNVTVPFLGQPYSIGQPAQQIDWWNFGY